MLCSLQIRHPVGPDIKSRLRTISWKVEGHTMSLEPQWIWDELVDFIRGVPHAFPSGEKSWSLALMAFFLHSGKESGFEVRKIAAVKTTIKVLSFFSSKADAQTNSNLPLIQAEIARFPSGSLTEKWIVLQFCQFERKRKRLV
jgi:hypothetical protein